MNESGKLNISVWGVDATALVGNVTSIELFRFAALML